MAERVGLVGDDAAAHDELRPQQLVERGPERSSGMRSTSASRRRENSRPMIAPTWATSFAGASRSRRDISESCSVDGMASGGSGPQAPAVGRVVEQAGLHHGLGQLLDEQRHAVGLGDDLGQHLGRQRPPAGHRRRQLGGLALPSRFNARRVRFAAGGHGGVYSGRSVTSTSSPHVARLLDRQRDEFGGGRIDPVHVLDQQQHRQLARQRAQQVHRRLQRLRASRAGLAPGRASVSTDVAPSRRSRCRARHGRDLEPGPDRRSNLRARSSGDPLTGCPRCARSTAPADTTRCCRGTASTASGWSHGAPRTGGRAASARCATCRCRPRPTAAGPALRRRASSQRSSSSATSLERPMNSPSASSCWASNRVATLRARAPATPAPVRRSPERQLLERLEVEAAPDEAPRLVGTTISPGWAWACNRAARFGVSPLAVRSAAAVPPPTSPTTTRPVAMPMRVCSLAPACSAGRPRRRARERRPHRAPGVVLVRPRVTEVDQAAVAEQLRHVAVEGRHRTGHGRVVAADHPLQVLRGRAAPRAGSSRPDRRT